MAIDKNVVEDFLDAIKQPAKKTNTTHNATVTRIDETGNVWVQVSGSDKETPTSSTSSEVKRGDAVTVEWRNNKLYIAGNYSNPSAGVTRVANVENDARIANEAARMALTDAQTAQDAAESAQASATIAAGAASDAQTAAESAQSSADSALVGLATVEDVVGVLNWITEHGTMTLTSDVAINPDHVYFIVNPAGDYEVGGTHYSVVAEPDVADIGTYYELSVDESVQNYVVTHLAVNTEGLWIIPDMNGTPTTNGKKILIATGAGSTYTTAGTYIIDRSSGVDKIMASFRSDGATIGENANGKSRTEISATGMQIIRNVSGTDTQIANLGYGSGNNEQGTTSNAPYYSLGVRIGDVGNYSVAEGSNVVAKGFATHAEGRTNIASGEYSHAEGTKTSARGAASHSEGNSNHGTVNIVDGVPIPVIGGIDASGQGAHAEGYAVNNSSWDIKASGDGSHAEGYADGTHGHITASGKGAHAQNCGTVAASDYQTAIGVCNVEDNNNTYALICGNGTSNNARSNALTVDWSGNVNIASGANYKINGANLSASDIGAVPATRTVNNKALSSNISLDASDVGAAPAPVFIDVSDDNGCVVIGKLAMAWGVVNVTSGTSGSPSGGVTTYAGSETVDWSSLYGITYKNKPSVSLTWSGNYANQVSLSTYGTSTTSMTVYGRMLSSSQTRGIRWFVCGQLA